MAKQTKSEYTAFRIEWATVSIRTIKILVFAIIATTSAIVYWFWLRELPKPDINPVIPISSSTARFIDYEGRIEVKPKNEFEWKLASFKTDLHEGDRIRTAPDSSAKIKFDDGTEITIQSDTIVVINKSTNQRNQKSLVFIEEGEGDINAVESDSAPSVASEKIAKFKLAPGSTGIIVADEQTGEHSAAIDKGYGEATLRDNSVAKLNDLEQLKIDRTNAVVTKKLPFKPPLVSPQNGQIFEFLSERGLSIELKWRDVSNAVFYTVQISESPLFGKLSAERTLTKSSITVEIPKTRKKQYFWRVASVDKDKNRSPWSGPHQFVVHTPSTAAPAQSTDKTPPVLRITYMHPLLPFVQVEGKTEPDATLTLNEEIIDVKDDGSFVYTYTLQKTGWNDLLFIAEDPAGNKTRVVKRVNY